MKHASGKDHRIHRVFGRQSFDCLRDAACNAALKSPRDLFRITALNSISGDGMKQWAEVQFAVEKWKWITNDLGPRAHPVAWWAPDSFIRGTGQILDPHGGLSLECNFTSKAEQGGGRVKEAADGGTGWIINIANLSTNDLPKATYGALSLGYRTPDGKSANVDVSGGPISVKGP